jgi:hypothetical protein
LVEKVPEGKRHDSNTDPTYQIGSIYGGRTDDVEHLEASLKDLHFSTLRIVRQYVVLQSLILLVGVRSLHLRVMTTTMLMVMAV